MDFVCYLDNLIFLNDTRKNDTRKNDTKKTLVPNENKREIIHPVEKPTTPSQMMKGIGL